MTIYLNGTVFDYTQHLLPALLRPPLRILSSDFTPLWASDELKCIQPPPQGDHRHLPVSVPNSVRLNPNSMGGGQDRPRDAKFSAKVLL